MIQNLKKARSPSGEELDHTCRQVVEEIDRLSRVTTSLAGLSRPVQARLSVVGVSELLTRVEWPSRRLLEGRAVSLRVARPRREPASPSVRADADLTCQLLLGLVSNAADAAREEATIELGWREIANEIVFQVRDGGPGVPPENRHRIFDPFFTTKTEGTGLGLAVARDFAEAQGGVLVLEDAEGPGAMFALHLPRV